MTDYSASIKSSKSDKTVHSNASGSTLQASSLAEVKQDEEASQKFDKSPSIEKQSTQSSWKNSTTWINDRSGEDALRACIRTCKAGALSARGVCVSGVKYLFKGIWLFLYGVRRYYVELFFATIFSLSVVLLAFSVAIKANAPTDPVDIKDSTHGRLKIIMAFSIFMLIALPAGAILFRIAVRDSWADWDYLFWVVFILFCSSIFSGAAMAAGRFNRHGNNYPYGLQCTFGLSTPTAGLCEQVHIIKDILLAETVLTIVITITVGFAPTIAGYD